MHSHAYDAIAQYLQTMPVPTRVVEIGSRDINGGVRPLFAAASSYIGIDAAPGHGVDLVADGASFESEAAPDVVVCCEVLEHAANADAVVRNALRMLAPGGYLLVTCATDPRTPHSGIDGGTLHRGEFYRNVPPDALRMWLGEAGAEDVDVQVREDRGDLYALARKPTEASRAAATRPKARKARAR